ncbi:MAG: hypothetical protein KGJ78_12495 [Alphaproteobacteria bacterium]|nr:hypothetical protein [Alphaproteobacteria bacterium]
MGVARLLAKGWVLVCLYAGAHALRFALASGAAPIDVVIPIVVCVLLFGAMGLLFIGGYGASAALPNMRLLKPIHFIPGFDEMVFIVFVCVSFADQAFVAPSYIQGDIAAGLQSAIYYAVFGQRALVDALGSCALDGGRVFAAAFTWLLALIYVCSALSRLRLAAGIIRLERTTRPEALGPTALAAILGIVAVAGIQFFFVGTAYRWLPCSAYADITGALLIGLAPLMLAYLIVAALAALLASGHEK